MFEQIYNFLKLTDYLFSSGMPQAEQIADAPKNGI